MPSIGPPSQSAGSQAKPPDASVFAPGKAATVDLPYGGSMTRDVSGKVTYTDRSGNTSTLDSSGNWVTATVPGVAGPAFPEYFPPEMLDWTSQQWEQYANGVDAQNTERRRERAASRRNSSLIDDAMEWLFTPTGQKGVTREGWAREQGMKRQRQEGGPAGT